MCGRSVSMCQVLVVCVRKCNRVRMSVLMFVGMFQSNIFFMFDDVPVRFPELPELEDKESICFQSFAFCSEIILQKPWYFRKKEKGNTCT